LPDDRVDEERNGQLVTDHQTGAEDGQYVQKEHVLDLLVDCPRF
jgi:hypothetical protein